MKDYDTDVLGWSERQARLLRRRAAGGLVNDGELDWANIAEEIDSVERLERSALTSHVGAIIKHLMKLEASPAAEPRAGWKETIVRARAAVGDLLEDSLSLRQTLDAVIARAVEQRRLLVAEVLALYGEVPLLPLEQIDYNAAQVLGGWFPA